jgi:hypothetical protein
VAEVATVVLGGEAVVDRLRARLGGEVVASTPEDHLVIAGEVAARADHVVGVSAVPWPRADEVHAQASETVGSYTGVVSWHALPTLAERLAEVAAPGIRQGAHLLVTAPDPGPATAPEDLTFLREVAEALETRLQPRTRSIAWRGTERQPTAVTALQTLVEAHEQRLVVECPVAPGTGADPALQLAADELGVTLTCVDLGKETLVDLLVEVVATVASHEGLA